MIEKLNIRDFAKCASIWDMERRKDLADRFYRELLSGNRITFVYVSGHIFVGEVSLVFDMHDPDYTRSGRRVYLSRLLVKKECRRRGIGGALVDFAANAAKKRGYSEISVGVDLDNHPARRLYAQKGFDRVIYEGADEQGPYQKLLKNLP